MPPKLAWTLRLIDGAMILYWVAASAACLCWIEVPPGWMYDGYGTPLVDAWNWSFAPLDLAFAAAGFAALTLARRGDPRWRALAIVSLALTFCAGLMAVAFWTLQRSFDAAWWVPNLALVAVAIGWLARLVNDRSTQP